MTNLSLPKKLRLLILYAGFGTAILVSGCGGGGGGGKDPNGVNDRQLNAGEPNQVSGTVAVGKPLANVSVVVHSLNNLQPGDGVSVVDTKTDASGRYSVNLDDLQPPYLVTAYNPNDAIYPILSAISAKSGTVNVTPFTDLAATQIKRANQPSGSYVADATSLMDIHLLTKVTGVQIDHAHDAVVNYLLKRPSKLNHSEVMPVDVSMVTDFVNTPFSPVPGDPYDDALETFTASLLDGENLFGVTEHMLNKSVGIANVNLLSHEYLIQCRDNVCGQPAYIPAGDIVAPYHAKYSLVDALLMQILNRSAATQVDCGPTPSLPGVVPGLNHIYVNNGVLGINVSIMGGYKFPLLSARQMWMQVRPFGGNPNLKYIESLHAVTAPSYAAPSSYMDVFVGFDSETKLTGIGISVTKDGVTQEASCTAV